jgi:hypothetical protein
VPVNTGDFHFSDPIVLVLLERNDPNRRFLLFAVSSIKSTKQENRMEITIYRRHSKGCPQKADRYATSRRTGKQSSSQS